jgi:hypothetical protein
MCGIDLVWFDLVWFDLIWFDLVHPKWLEACTFGDWHVPLKPNQIKPN